MPNDTNNKVMKTLSNKLIWNLFNLNFISSLFKYSTCELENVNYTGDKYLVKMN